MLQCKGQRCQTESFFYLYYTSCVNLKSIRAKVVKMKVPNKLITLTHSSLYKFPPKNKIKFIIIPFSIPLQILRFAQTDTRFHYNHLIMTSSSRNRKGRRTSDMMEICENKKDAYMFLNRQVLPVKKPFAVCAGTARIEEDLFEIRKKKRDEILHRKRQLRHPSTIVLENKVTVLNFTRIIFFVKMLN